MELNKTVRYIINPSIRLKRESHRCVIYKIDSFFHSPDSVGIIHPIDVVFLLLFDSSRLPSEVERDYKIIFPNQDASFIIDKAFSFLSKRLKIEDLVVDSAELSGKEIEETLSRYKAEDFLIPADVLSMDCGNLRLEAPLSVNYNVSTYCGFKCKYCYHPLTPINEYIPLDRLRIVFQDLKDNKCESILLTGGDPICRPDIDDLMIELHKIGLFYTLSTKSILSESRIKKLFYEAGLDRMQLSVDSANSKIITELIGADEDYLCNFKKQVQVMKSIGMDVRCKAVLTSYNADFLNEYFQMMCDLGVKHVQIVGYGRSGTRHNDKLFPSRKQQEIASETVENWKQKKTGMEIVGGGFSVLYDEPVELKSGDDIFAQRVVCNAGRFSLTLMPNGKVFVCEQIPYSQRHVIGDLNKDSLLECWNGALMQNWLSPPPRYIFPEDSYCRKCKDDDYNKCHVLYSRCLRFIYEHTGDTCYPDIKCPFARIKKTRIT